MPKLLPPTPDSTLAEVAAAAETAGRAFRSYGSTPPEKRAEFLETIAVRLEELGDDLIQTAHEETALPAARLSGERTRTCGQLRMFANLIRSDAWLDVRIEKADPSRQPLPKPDLRRTQVPLGPVAVFGASNFPLAYSVPGGDTASALAAGCPVIVKAHPAHPETSRLCAEAIAEAVRSCQLPEGTFQVVWGGTEVGQALVRDPHIEAVGFTGSLRAGRALFDLAAGRPRPIPVYAEMGSVNPVFVFPGVVDGRAESFAKGYAESLSLGIGQFCTNPGVLVGLASDGFDALIEKVAEFLSLAPAGQMLTPAIANAYANGVQERLQDSRLTAHVFGEAASPALFSTDAVAFLADRTLREELFGPAALVVKCEGVQEMEAVALALEGQLTSTVHFEPSDVPNVKNLLPSLVHISGRLVANGFPTGVEVNSAMQHGGPYPATTDSRTTSVGTAAILRFIRPVAFQNFPSELLPRELQG